MDKPRIPSYAPTPTPNIPVPKQIVQKELPIFDGDVTDDLTAAIATAEAASIPIGYLSTDGTMAADSNVLVPSQAAVITYVASEIALIPPATDPISGEGNAIVILTRADYNALSPPVATTLYFIDG